MNLSKKESTFVESLIPTAGVLLTEELVRVSASPDSPTHRRFEWEDTVAAHKFRLSQAREIIQAVVYKIEGRDVEPPTRVLCSLFSDRKNGGGYRNFGDVMGDDVRRREMRFSIAKDLRDQARRLQAFGSEPEAKLVLESIDAFFRFAEAESAQKQLVG